MQKDANAPPKEPAVWKMDLVLPSQHFGPRRKQAPEQRLMIAVLHDAIDCLARHRFAKDTLGRRIFEETIEWFVAVESDWPYSFEGICGVLDLDLDAVREQLGLVPLPRLAPAWS